MAANDCNTIRWSDLGRRGLQEHVVAMLLYANLLQVEYMLLVLDKDAREASVLASATDVIRNANAFCKNRPFEPEAYKFMVESQPGVPYGSEMQELLRVERDMSERRNTIRKQLRDAEDVFTISNFAMFQSPHASVGTIDANSCDLITDNARYHSVVANMYARSSPSSGERNQHPATETSIGSSLFDRQRHEGMDSANSVNDSIHSLGGCGLQLTLSAEDLEQARFLHDQLIPLGPIMMALSAATPLLKGRLVETDTRWAQLSMAADDRTASEKTSLPPPLGISPMYLQDRESVQKLNTSLPPELEAMVGEFTGSGIDLAMSRYLAHALSRDPLISTQRSTTTDLSPVGEEDDFRVVELMTHFSTFWPHVRLKLPLTPGASPSLPWRLEFRPLEIQPTDFENASFVVFVRLLQMTISHFDLDLCLPMPLVVENMRNAQAKAAALKSQFWFSIGQGPNGAKTSRSVAVPTPRLCSLDFIIHGSVDATEPGSGFSGLLSLVKDFVALRYSDAPEAELQELERHLDFVSGKARGSIPTTAQWIRSYLDQHPLGSDNVVASRAYYDLLCEIRQQSCDRTAVHPLSC
ncbi:hypothetical protein LTR56_004803 [Elasticomyces elasticus]|nr:hypothetical protein LTR56_004803 [Elasticomyces elasticus]KAK3664577.1 hypothetical protein LTR22_004445 [Elasticomyces elasticus]KAK5760287.1 hypothetical protein LTS12_009501 [Elasticomyces elasticus]